MKKRPLKVIIDIPAGGKHAGRIEFTIDPEKVTEADREWAAGLMRRISDHLASRRKSSPSDSITAPGEG